MGTQQPHASGRYVFLQSHRCATDNHDAGTVFWAVGGIARTQTVVSKHDG